MSKAILKPIAVALMLALVPISISNVQAAAVKVGSYVGIWSAKTSYSAGDLITLNNKTFLSLVAKNKNKNPNSNPKAWQLLGGVGADGLQGPIGLTGAAGINGSIGSKGDTGLQGLIGLTGPVGANGSKGDIGLTGTVGASGINGTNGIDGVVGPKGDTGLQGLIGLTGAAGTNGVDGTIGPKGDTGAAGTNGVDGAVGPKGDIGLQGPIGLTGLTGANGIDGAVGPKGDTGLQGPTGTNGTNGTNGIDGGVGPKGDTGLQGLTGTAGTNGAVGAQGIQGIQGVKGNTGLAGASGAGAGVLKVFDANHNVIGDYHDAYRRVFMDINGKIYALTVASDGFGENIDHNMQFYSTNDCTGTAYYNFFVSNTTDFGLNDYLWVANKIYEFDHTKAVSITANSMLALNSCDNTGSGFTPRTIQAALFEDLILIQDLSIYPTPFTIGKE